MLFSSRCFIELLGGLRVRLTAPAQAERSVTRFRTRATGALLAYLAYHPNVAHERDKLIDLFWPDESPSIGRNKLSLALSALRRVLDLPGSGVTSALLADRFTVQLHPDTFTTDVQRFQAALDAATRAANAGERVAMGQSLDEAIRLYQGELLPQFDDEWILSGRFLLAEQLCLTLRKASELHAADGNLDAALPLARRAIQIEPDREDSHRHLISLLLQAGQPEQARQQFLHLRQLTEELGMAPAPETEEMVRHLLVEPESRSRKRLPKKGNIPRPKVTVRGEAVLPPAGEVVQAPPAARQNHPALPLRLTRFFGREEEKAAVLTWLGSGRERLVTLTGMGGVGKTRLALEIAAQLFDQMDAVYFVPLAGVSDASAIPSAIGAALGLSHTPTVLSRDQVAAHLATLPRTLLVLDNLEHLLDSPGTPPVSESEGNEGLPFLQALLARVPGLQCLVTSRVRLPLPGGQVMLVPPLPTPLPNQSDPSHSDVKHLLSWPSVSLFVDRAQAARPDFQITPRNAATLGELCRLLEGIPLSLELTAAWASALTPSQMLTRLTNTRWDVLKIRRDQRHVSPRHHSLRTVLSASCALLPPEVQSFFLELSVFRGGWTLDAAEMVTGEALAVDYLAQLQDASLVRAHQHENADSTDDTLRFSMQEITRQFAAEHLVEKALGDADNVSHIHKRHAVWCRDFATSALTFGGFGRLEQESDNLDVALEWSLAHDAELALSLSSLIWPFWEQKGRLHEGRRRLEQVLGQEVPEKAEVLVKRAQCLSGHGKICFVQGDFVSANASLQAGLDMGRAVGDSRSVATALLHLGILSSYRADLDAADAQLQEGLLLHRNLSDRQGTSASLLNWGIVAGCREQYELSRARWREALTIARDINDKHLVAYALCYLGDNVIWLGGQDECEPLFNEVLTISREADIKFTTCYAYVGLGRLACLQKRYEQAHQIICKAHLLSQEMSADWAFAFALEVSACASSGQTAYETAVVLWGAAAKLREEVGAPLPTAYRDIYEPFKATARKDLGETSFDTAWQRGTSLSRSEALALALSLSGTH